MLQGRVLQDAWNRLFFSIIAISVAATLNGRNSVWGYWVSLTTVGIADTGFISFVLVPAYAPVWPSILGPLLGAGDDFLDDRSTDANQRRDPEQHRMRWTPKRAARAKMQ
jgi:hypothetical protein